MQSISNNQRIERDLFKRTLTLYLELYALDPIHRFSIALHVWSRLTPPQRRTLQIESQTQSAGSLKLSQDYTQSVLLFSYAQQSTQD